MATSLKDKVFSPENVAITKDVALMLIGVVMMVHIVYIIAELKGGVFPITSNIKAGVTTLEGIIFTTMAVIMAWKKLVINFIGVMIGAYALASAIYNTQANTNTALTLLVGATVAGGLIYWLRDRIQGRPIWPLFWVTAASTLIQSCFYEIVFRPFPLLGSLFFKSCLLLYAGVLMWTALSKKESTSPDPGGKEKVNE